MCGKCVSFASQEEISIWLAKLAKVTLLCQMEADVNMGDCGTAVLPRSRSALDGAGDNSVMRARRLSVVQLLDDFFTRIAAFAGRMSEAAAAHAILDIED
jgi:hypothetical protein